MIWWYWNEELLRGWEIYNTAKRRANIARFSTITGRTIKEAFEVIV
jgi:hypothetical protein